MMYKDEILKLIGDFMLDEDGPGAKPLGFSLAEVRLLHRAHDVRSILPLLDRGIADENSDARTHVFLIQLKHLYLAASAGAMNVVVDHAAAVELEARAKGGVPERFWFRLASLRQALSDGNVKRARLVLSSEGFLDMAESAAEHGYLLRQDVELLDGFPDRIK